MKRSFVVAGSALALLAILLGAFGTHLLEPRVTAERLHTFETAARYQMYHALALLLVGFGFDRLREDAAAWAGRLFLAGAIVFCGALYALALGAPRWFGAVAPIGGLGFITGWALLAAAALRS
jgi:uncharacterized membrane protein YgdD (TMEM256/DUF423 family)